MEVKERKPGGTPVIMVESMLRRTILREFDPDSDVAIEAHPNDHLELVSRESIFGSSFRGAGGDVSADKVMHGPRCWIGTHAPSSRRKPG
jgi:hypothetical protein